MNKKLSCNRFMNEEQIPTFAGMTSKRLSIYLQQNKAGIITTTKHKLIKVQQPKKRYSKSSIKANERMCCISSVLEFLWLLSFFKKRK